MYPLFCMHIKCPTIKSNQLKFCFIFFSSIYFCQLAMIIYISDADLWTGRKNINSGTKQGLVLITFKCFSDKKLIWTFRY